MMNNISNFYDILDLKYPEIGIAMQEIDRQNPGTVKFIIPILTPMMDNSRIIEQKIYQVNSNLRNANKKQIEVEHLGLANYVNIRMPKEVCWTPYDERYIPIGSKWIIVFVGGDITKPRVVARYYDE